MISLKFDLTKKIWYTINRVQEKEKNLFSPLPKLLLYIGINYDYKYNYNLLPIFIYTSIL